MSQKKLKKIEKEFQKILDYCLELAEEMGCGWDSYEEQMGEITAWECALQIVRGEINE